MAATLKVTNDMLKMSVLDRSTASMSHIRHYRVVPWATGPLTLLESISKVQTGKSLVFSFGDKMKTATVKVGGITQNTEKKHARFQENYSKVCITRAAVNENVCEDSHTEHV